MSLESVLQLLVTRRERAGLTQGEVAERMSTSQPVIARFEAGQRDPRWSTLESYAAAIGADLQVSLDHHPALVHRRTAKRVAELVRDRLDTDASGTATFREVVQFVDDARTVDRPTLRSLIHDPPAPTGDPRWDAMIAAATEWLASTGHVACPNWVRTPNRRLEPPGWVLTPYRGLHDAVRANTPPAFARHGVYVDADSLESV